MAKDSYGLPQGGVIHGEGDSDWPIDVTNSGLPANQQILQLGTAGDGEVLVDNGARINKVLADLIATGSAPATETMDAGPANDGGGPDAGVKTVMALGDERKKNDGGLCSVAAPGTGSSRGLVTLLLAAGLWMRRRRLRQR